MIIAKGKVQESSAEEKLVGGSGHVNERDENNLEGLTVKC